MNTERYTQLRTDSTNNGDKGSCTVLAGCVAFDLTYQQGYSLLERHANRSKGRGLQRNTCVRAYEKINEFLGVDGKFSLRTYDQTELRRTFTNGATMTVNNCTTYLNPKKRYIIFVSRHAVGVKDGIVHDWSQGRKKPVEDIVEVICNDDYVETKPKSKVFKRGGFASVLANL